MKASTFFTQGQLVARFLAGSWRDQQTPLDLSSTELDLLSELLYHSGGAGLAWWRIRQSKLAETKSGEFIHQAYRLQALQSTIQEQRTETAFRLLREARIEPILLKGWALARFYPNQPLRAYGDIDLLVKPADFNAARALLDQSETSTWWIDLHKEVSELSDRSPKDLYARSRLVQLQATEVRVLSMEDQLALQAVHLFKHGGWRPSWLCDIGAMVESLSPAFDWEVCFGSNRRRASWISSAIALAHELLEADIDHVPLPPGTENPPRWLIEATLKQWGNLVDQDRLPVQPRRQFASSLRKPNVLVGATRERWPDPITATFNLNGSMGAAPRFPYQLGAFVLQTTRYLLRSLS
jgi:hypothetical protein